MSFGQDVNLIDCNEKYMILRAVELDVWWDKRVICAWKLYEKLW